MTSQYDKAIAEVNETFNFYMSMLAERKLDVVKELDKLYSSKQVALSVFGQKVHDSSDKIEQIVGFIEKLIQSAICQYQGHDILMFKASLAQVNILQKSVTFARDCIAIFLQTKYWEKFLTKT